MRSNKLRREMLVLNLLLSSTTDIIKRSDFKIKYAAAYRYVNVIDDMFQNIVPDRGQRMKETAAAMKVVNAILPVQFTRSRDEVKLWFFVQLVYRLVGSGWKLPTDPVCLEFVQSVYNMVHGVNIDPAPGVAWNRAVAKAPEALKAQGLFL